MTRNPMRMTIVLLAAGAAVLCGCQTGRFGSNLTEMPKRPLRVQQSEPTELSLPEREPFNITLTSTNEQPSLEGSATADARATSDGTAQAAAEVEHGGTAEGVFQLGHALTNDTDRQVDVAFTVRFTYEFATNQTPEVGLPDATIGLKLYARDDRGRLLRDLELVNHTTEHGVAQGRATEDVSFTLTIGPAGTLHVFLAGQARADVRDGRSASASLALRELSMAVKTRPAPPVRTAAHAQD